MIEFRNVTYGYGVRRPVLSGFDLKVGDGERIALMGRSGSGKTTILRLAAGLARPRSGSVTIGDPGRISCVFQEDRLIPWKSVIENVLLFAGTKDERGGTDALRRSAEELLTSLMIGEAADMLPGELSGGMRRRAALARALAHPFDVLLLDEAFTGLDAETARACINVVDRYAEGKTIIMATHTGEEAALLGAKVVTLQ